MKKWIWLGVFTVVLVWSAIHPKEYFIWFLEVFPSLIGFMLIVLTYQKIPLTPLLYTLILIHMIILMVGGHYTYAEVPLGEWFKELFHMSRNNYDKLGHFFQGFEPAILAREILIRKEVVKHSRLWLHYIVLSIVLAFSAFYELVEWWVAMTTGEAAEAFLGTQGYAWDTQSDMMYAFIGGVTALLLLSRLHDRQLEKLGIRN